jgi:hypothetical protein
MEDRRIPKKIQTYNPKKKTKCRTPTVKMGGTSILFNKTERTTHGLIHEEDADDGGDDRVTIIGFGGISNVTILGYWK